MRKVYHLIRQMGVTSKYKGYYFVADAVKLSMETAGYPLRITKDVYPPLARKYKSTPNNIEHDIRTVVNVCWCANKDQMDKDCRISSELQAYKQRVCRHAGILSQFR